jgi:hypothetical protein
MTDVIQQRRCHDVGEEKQAVTWRAMRIAHDA